MILQYVIIFLMVVIAVCMVLKRPLKIEIKVNLDKDARIQEVRPDPGLSSPGQDQQTLNPEDVEMAQLYFDGIERLNNFLETGDPTGEKQTKPD